MRAMKRVLAGVGALSVQRKRAKGRGMPVMLEGLESRLLMAATANVVGAGVSITDGSTTTSRTNYTDYGPIGVTSGFVYRTYTIQNTGDAVLTLSGISIAGAHAADFSITTQPGTNSINPGASTTFTVTFDPSAAGTRNGQIQITTNDPARTTYDFNIAGTGLNTTTTSSGLQVATTQAGSGSITTTAGHRLRVNYTGYLLDGTKFDSSLNPGRSPFEFTLGVGQVIAGWDEGMAGMKVGEKRTLIVPPSIGYGSSGSGNVPPNATMIFETELLAVLGPSIQVTGNSVAIATGDTTPSLTDWTSFGSTATGTTVTRTYVITNAGPGSLFFTNNPWVVLSGANANQFTVTQPTIANNQAMFTVSFKPTAVGNATAIITIPTNDPTKGNYNFTVGGTAVNATPIGSFDVANRTTFAGWAFDADAGAGAVKVRFDIDSVVGTPITANVTRNDLTAFLGSPNHGFSIAAPAMNNGAHVVEMYVEDATSSNYVKVATKNIAAANRTPIGSFDVANRTTFAGWAFDADAGATPVKVRFDIDGVQGTPITASVTRNDLAPYLGSANHGFNIAAPAMNNAAHVVEMYVEDVTGGGYVKVATKNIAAVNATPIGSFDVANRTTFAGWAFDADAGATSVKVRFDIDGVQGTPVTASVTRNDLAGFLGSANHGFSISAPVMTAAAHVVEMYVEDATGGGYVKVATKNIAAVASPPIGSIDVANRTQVIGWAFDFDLGAAAVTVRVDIDGVVGTPASAALTRNDLAPFLGSANHGYNITLPTLADGARTLRVVLLNSQTNEWILLGTRVV